MTPIEDAKALLEANGFTVLRTKSYNAARRRQQVAEALLASEERHNEGTLAWARDCLAKERSLMARCTFLYGEAMARGATAEELRGGA